MPLTEIDSAIAKNYRIGLIVPSSNTTMETEIPAMLRARESVLPERFTFHSSRMRMKSVTKARRTPSNDLIADDSSQTTPPKSSRLKWWSRS